VETVAWIICMSKCFGPVTQERKSRRSKLWTEQLRFGREVVGVDYQQLQVGRHMTHIAGRARVSTVWWCRLWAQGGKLMVREPNLVSFPPALSSVTRCPTV
jgi:hypothetical protein